MKRFLSVFLILVTLCTTFAVSCAVPASAATSRTVKGGFNYSYAKSVCSIINSERKKANLGGLVLDNALTNAAMIRAAEISVYYSHTRPNKTDCSTAFRWTSCYGENIAWGQHTPSDVMYSWMHSTVHKKNILTRGFTRVGVGCFYNPDGKIYWVQVFSGGKSSAACQKTGRRYVDVSVSYSKNLQTSYRIKIGVPVFKSIDTSWKKYVYDGKNHKPVLTVKDTNGKVVSNSYYRIEYPSSIMKVGDYDIKVTDLYRAKTYRVRVYIIPRTPVVTSIVKIKTRQYRFTWNPVKGADDIYYEVLYSQYPNFKNSVSRYSHMTDPVVTFPERDTLYYVKVRALIYRSYGHLNSACTKVYTVRS